MARYRDPSHKSPKTIEACKQDMIQHCRLGADLIARLHRTGEWDSDNYKIQRERNPNRLGEVSVSFTASKREWQAARVLVSEGVLVLISGSLAGEGDHTVNHALLLAGPKFPA